MTSGFFLRILVIGFSLAAPVGPFGLLCAIIFAFGVSAIAAAGW